MPLPEVCVVFMMRTGADGLEVLLGDRLTGTARGRVVGVGGALQRDETARGAAVRGLLEEVGVGVAASDLREAGVVERHFPTRPTLSEQATVFVCRRFTGIPAASATFAPRWFPLAEIPYGRMRADTVRWLPGVLRGGGVDARFTFGADLSTVVMEAS
ncbi:NUDIX domain-containing protein [Microbacterium sp. NPDC056003]|uniref:NUDIX domain-containing protein n=1 Tax=Microbacterium sp. NPDC056003 TaxID=3345676 RepID=UPI0035DB94A7